jgi:hypothetical protein
MIAIAVLSSTTNKTLSSHTQFVAMLAQINVQATIGPFSFRNRPVTE